LTKFSLHRLPYNSFDNWLKVKVKVKVTLRPSVGQSVSNSWCRAQSGAHDQIFITVWQLRCLVFVGSPLSREDGSVFCICRWSLPAQSFSGQSLGTRDHILLSQILDTDNWLFFGAVRLKPP
jgi:hypothetical protein